MRTRSLAHLLAALVPLVAAACTRAPREAAGPARAPVEAFFSNWLQSIDPRPAAGARAVLALEGVPIRQGDFERLEELLTPLAPPDRARQPILEEIFLAALAPRSIALGLMPRAELSRILAIFTGCRDARGHYDLERLNRELAPLSSEKIEYRAVLAAAPSEFVRGAPQRAAALARLVRPGQQVGPIVTRRGVYVFELIEAPPAGADLRTPRRIHAGGLSWRFPPIDGAPPGTRIGAWIDERLRAHLRSGDVAVLDEEYRIAVPRWQP